MLEDQWSKPCSKVQGKNMVGLKMNKRNKNSGGDINIKGARYLLRKRMI
jgi:hypothetical protein